MSTLWVIGDSTVSSFEDKYYYPRYGYGTMLDKYLNDNVKVVNIHYLAVAVRVIFQSLNIIRLLME